MISQKNLDSKEVRRIIMEEDRKITLLKACMNLLRKQKHSSSVLDLLSETVFYDDAWCDGYCLIEDIKAELEMSR